MNICKTAWPVGSVCSPRPAAAAAPGPLFSRPCVSTGLSLGGCARLKWRSGETTGWELLQRAERSGELPRALVSKHKSDSFWSQHINVISVCWLLRLRATYFVFFSSPLVLKFNAEAFWWGRLVVATYATLGGYAPHSLTQFALYKHSHCPAFHSKPCSLKLPHYANATTRQVPICFSGNDFKSKLAVYKSNFLRGPLLQAVSSFKSLIAQLIML